jgi:hypothetical protein
MRLAGMTHESGGRILALLAVTGVVAACGNTNNRKPQDASVDTASVKGDDVALDGVPDRTPEIGPDAGDATVEKDTGPAQEVSKSDTAKPDLGPDRTLAEVSSDLATDVPMDVAFDVGNADDAGEVNLGSCSSSLAGTAAFGAALAGQASFAGVTPVKKEPITGTVTVQIYFPQGRVAGGSVLLAMPSPVVPDQYFSGTAATLADDLTASLSVHGHDMQVTADLLPGSGGLVAKVKKNFADAGTDVADLREATMLMCPSGDVPAPSLRVRNAMVSPIAPLLLSASTPIALDQLAALRIGYTRGTVNVTFTADEDTPSSGAVVANYLATPTTAFPPGEPLGFDASGVHDVLGRPVTISATSTQLLAPEVSTNIQYGLGLRVACSGPVACNSTVRLNWDGGVRDGMYLCNGGCAVTDGGVTIENAPVSTSNLDSVFTLSGNVATKVRVRLAVGDAVEAGTGCINGTSYAAIRWGKMAVVGRDGEIGSEVSLTCDGIMADRELSIPNSFSYRYLVIHLEGVSAQPYSLPPAGLPPVNIEAITQSY